MDAGLYSLTSKCIGCGLCKEVCRQQAISLVEDAYGFVYPSIDKGRCSACGLCEKMCPANRKKEVEAQEQCVYAAQSKNEKILENSSSGGIFSELAGWFLENDGVVVGAEMDIGGKVKHVVIDHKNELYRIQRSKYVESYFGDVLPQIKKNMERRILICGTPCQIYAAKSYIGERENILYCDIVCHGVNSPEVFRRYIGEREKEYGSRAIQINFRDKSYGWETYALKIVFENGKEYRISNKEEPFLRGFIKNFYLRTACNECEYREKKRVGDITLGDFWGIKEDDNFKRSQGISLVILNSLKARNYFDKIKGRIYFEKRTWENACERNVCIMEKNVFNTGMKYFRENYDTTESVTALIREALECERRERNEDTRG